MYIGAHVCINSTISQQTFSNLFFHRRVVHRLSDQTSRSCQEELLTLGVAVILGK
jgi:hypothetical protein